MPTAPLARVLICTGGLVTPKERSVYQALRKQVLQWRASESAWLELKIKALIAEPLLAGFLERRSPSFKRTPQAKVVAEYFSTRENFDTPELTEVVLAGLLRDENLDFDVATFDDLFYDGSKSARLLDAATVVFVSSTLLRDLSELAPLVKRLKRPHNRIVVGGALAGSLCHSWQGMPEVDVLAVGYGEMIVPSLAAWIRSGFTTLEPPASGRIEKRAHTLFLHSGSPAGKSLDFLPTPDWALANERHATRFRMIHYESVRGCPYRCSFCNYPFLFDDDKFRYKSAQKIANDWERYAKDLGVEWITCLDSLFTMPKARLVELCEELIRRGVRLKWICYARATDLADESVVALMKRAGCEQVQIGLESGDQLMLDNMNKRTKVDQNRRALVNCRTHGMTSVVTLIVGFPGESKLTLDRTFEFMRGSPPDFHFLATFSTRVLDVPVLQPASRRRFGLKVMENAWTVSPYWAHDTMSCAEVGNHARTLTRRLMDERVSLDAALFYQGILGFRPDQREALLDFQQRAARRHPLARKALDVLNGWIDRRLVRDVDRFLAGATIPQEPAQAAHPLQQIG